MPPHDLEQEIAFWIRIAARLPQICKFIQVEQHVSQPSQICISQILERCSRSFWSGDGRATSF